MADVCDFAKHCEERRGLVRVPAGVWVPYHRCATCGFLFTVVFDHWDAETFNQRIYNEAYAAFDPDYEALRPDANAKLTAKIAPRAKPHRVLDYGGGNGRLTTQLRRDGWHGAESWDPLTDIGPEPDSDAFMLVTAFEVLEHQPNPHAGFRDMARFLAPEGTMLVSTLVQPPHAPERPLLDWWYAAPRNGHISLHTRTSLAKLTAHHGFVVRHLDDYRHVFRRTD